MTLASVLGLLATMAVWLMLITMGPLHTFIVLSIVVGLVGWLPAIPLPLLILGGLGAFTYGAVHARKRLASK